MKKNRLSTSAKPLALESLTDSDAVQVNGGVFGLTAPGGGHVFGVIINPNPPTPTPTPTPKHHHKHHKKPPFFGVPVHP